MCSVRSGREALTRRANTKKKTRRRWKRCWDEAKSKEEGEKAERGGRRKGEERDKARRRFFKVKCKLCRPSACLYRPPLRASTNIKAPLSILLRPGSHTGNCRHPATGLSHDLPLSPSLIFLLSFSVHSYSRCFSLSNVSPTLRFAAIPHVHQMKVVWEFLAIISKRH